MGLSPRRESHPPDRHTIHARLSSNPKGASDSASAAFAGASR
jgi:hypothetical protein